MPVERIEGHQLGTMGATPEEIEEEVNRGVLTTGYSDPGATRSCITRGWFRTGDLATVDQEGWLTIVGRIKDIIIRGGENIAAGEVKAQSSNFLRALAVNVAEDLDRGLYERYRQVEALAEHPAIRAFGKNPGGARKVIERFVSRNDLYSWLAIADPAGKVVMANGGLLEGLDVAFRPWFKPSMKGPYVGDVHPAVLLAKLIPTPEGMAPFFVDIAFPILDDRGRPLGVLVAHVNWRMAADIIDSLRRQTWRDFRCMLLDDCSADGTVAAARRAIEGDSRFDIID